MEGTSGGGRFHPAWWTAILLAALVLALLLTAAMFAGSFRSFVPVSVTADRSGLVMESGAKVRMRGIEVGRVSHVNVDQPVRLQLEIYPDQIKYIPSNVQAQIRASTAFGSKYVDLVYPSEPTARRLTTGAVLHAENVSTEVNTVFQNLVGVLKQVDPPKLNAVLTALAEAVRGKGAVMGEATSDAAQVISQLNARSEMIGQDFRSTRGFADAYGAAAKDLVAIMHDASTTSTTISNQAKALDALLLSAIGFSNAGINLLGPNRSNLIDSINLLKPTTNLLMKYNPEFTCLLVGAKWYGDHAVATGTNGYSSVIDAGLGTTDEMYKYPDNLPIIGAKGGPDGKPGCGSLPDASKDYPVRYLVTNTGWGTGLDLRPNVGIGHPWWLNFFPLTRGTPEPLSVHGLRPPSIGPNTYPGAPPYGAPLFNPDGTPIWAPPPPGVPPPPVPGIPLAPPPYGPPAPAPGPPTP
ncbi:MULTISPECIES: MCE family protein [Mycobacterium]|uniref:MCE family protein n=1 Tax=Mycobacterium TaxID=1763 RepID=UPI00200DA166|nr:MULTISPECIES: MCE family protein [Mycobacterium]UQB93139.1 MCE family protein [Mycobacterium intracellulare]WSE46146.1 MCE family protein [Mycobacterium sp. 3-98]